MNPGVLRAFLKSGLLALAASLGGCRHGPAEAVGRVAPVAPVRVNPPERSGDAFVILTGGGTPLTNEYSHYLQARALSDFFHARYPAEAVWTFFGVGNRTDAPGILSDVHRQTKDGSLVLDSWFPGALRGNRPASKENFLATLRDEILPRVASGGTLYLFIGDHGEIAPAKDGESAVTMWQLRRTTGGRGWNTDNRGVLTVTELRAALAGGLGRGRVVFCMTQCHSGGFHFLGVPRDVTKPGGPPLRVAGFTATDEENVAAGCDPDPDPENWAGYERFIPEALLGVDLMTGARRGAAGGSFDAAHEAASLVDFTIDLPRASSEQLLDGWADQIESKFGRTLTGSAAERRAFQGYQQVLDGRASVTGGDPALLERAERFQRLTAALARQFPGTAKLLASGTRQELEAALNAREPRGGGGSGRRGGGGAPTRRLWTDTIRPAWKAAVNAGPAPAILPAAAVRFEKRLLELEDGGRDFFAGGGRRGSALNEVYWLSGQSAPVVTDRARADAVPRWAAERRQKILEWARSADSEAVRTAAATIAAAPARGPGAGREPAINKTAVERVLFYRRVLGAWAFLIATENGTALAQLAALIELEKTPLPPAIGMQGPDE